MSGQVARDHLMMRLKCLDLRLPVGVVARVPMDENQCRFARALPVVEKTPVL